MEKLITKRGNICDKCENKQFIICTKCGCVIWTKIRLQNESCPIGKW